MNGDGVPISDWLTRNHILLFRAALLNGDEAPASWENWNKRVDFEGDHLDLFSYRLMPFVYRNLADQNYRPKVMAKLKGLYRRTWLENQLYIKQITPIIQRLHNAGVQVLLLDDMTSILNLYEGRGLGHLFSMDILVHKTKVLDALHELGKQDIWPKVWYPERFLIVKTPVEFWPMRGLRLTFTWRVFPTVVSEECAGEFWQRKCPAVLDDFPVFTSDLETHILRRCSRVVRGRPEEAIFALVDVAWMLYNRTVEIDWVRLIEVAHVHRLVLPLRDTLRLLSDIHVSSSAKERLDELEDVKLSRLDRIEHRLMISQSSRIVYRAFSMAIQYHRSPKQRGWLSFPIYLIYIWGVRRLRMLPAAALHRLRNAFRRQ